jgi:molybdenum cofactor synthesis domain-containing protein
MCDSSRHYDHDECLARIPIEEAVGTRLAHDITEVRPGQYKGPRFRKGHKIEQEDLCHLARLGKRHLYVLDLTADQVHEDDAVAELAAALSGPGVTYGAAPKEGKLQLCAAYDGLLKINAEALVELNLIPEVMCASLHNEVPVRQGQILAGTRAIPLVIDRSVLDRAVALARRQAPVFCVKAYQRLRARLIITGNEVYNGLIEDKFEQIVRSKLEAFGASLEETVILPDDRQAIADHTRRYLSSATDLIITTGGMSVDPDDVTRLGIRDAGVQDLFYGAAVLPGAMAMLAYNGKIPIVGIPACGLYHEATVFDVLLPRLLAGENPDNRDLARLCIGGLCLNCAECRYPACSFGKTAG